MKTNEEIAREIAAKLGGFQEAFDGAMAMAKIKDKQIESVLRALSGDTGDPRLMCDENDLCDKAKPLDADISKIVSDNFWNLVTIDEPDRTSEINEWEKE